jgi:hypothetical protein
MTELDDLISDRFRSALGLLLTAFDYAQDSGSDRWQFAVEVSELLSNGATLADIRWLILRGFAEHAKETTTPGDAKRSFRPLAPTSFPPDAFLVLSPAGATLRPTVNRLREDRQGLSPIAPSPLMGEGRGEGAASPSSHGTVSRPCHSQTPALPSPQPQVPSPQLPIWDRAHRELRYRGQIIKRYRVPAPNQELILAAFQEEGWPEFIDDPLPPVDEQDPKHRLQVTIKSLNRSQLVSLIRFHGNGNGLQVHWETVQPD